MLNYKHILYATDLHETCGLTLKRLIDFAAKFDARISVVHVVKPISGAYGYTAGIVNDVDHDIEDEATTKIDALMASVELDKSCGHLLRGALAGSILQYADDSDIDAIVINGHSHNIFARMGSTEDTVVNNATCDVLVLR